MYRSDIDSRLVFRSKRKLYIRDSYIGSITGNHGVIQKVFNKGT